MECRSIKFDIKTCLWYYSHMLIKRYHIIEKHLDPNKVVVIYGPRRVGKTTLVNHYLKTTRLRYRSDSGENMEVQRILSSQNFDLIKAYVGDYELIVIDEAQHVPNIGTGLKIIVDQIPGIKVIATGSSSFDLSGQIGEPLTGRKWTLTLYPLAQLELQDSYSRYELTNSLNEFLIFGGYPSALTARTRKAKREAVEEIAQSYLLKDLLSLENVKSPQILVDLLKLLAFQIGSEVSYNELANQLSIDVKTVERYLDLLEKTFIIFRLRGYNLNLRKTIRSKHKYYFFDLGIRNAVISQFNSLDLRQDIGQLWENFLAVERLKKQEYKSIHANNYFWRTWDGQEVDWVEMRNGALHGYEFKWANTKKVKQPKDWQKAFGSYGKTTFQVIDRENYLDFIL